MDDFKKYKDLPGGAGIVAFKISERSITLRFRDGGEYEYDYTIPGKKHVEQMKILAEKGKGLTTYVNQNIRQLQKEIELNKKASHF